MMMRRIFQYITQTIMPILLPKKVRYDKILKMIFWGWGVLGFGVFIMFYLEYKYKPSAHGMREKVLFLATIHWGVFATAVTIYLNSLHETASSIRNFIIKRYVAILVIMFFPICPLIVAKYIVTKNIMAGLAESERWFMYKLVGGIVMYFSVIYMAYIIAFAIVATIVYVPVLCKLLQKIKK